MFEIISKDLYWGALDDPSVEQSLDRTSRRNICLKHIQDAWILSKLSNVVGSRILEVGGGFGRVLRTLDNNERWNLDKPAGQGRTASNNRVLMPKEYNVVHSFLGEFSDDVPSDNFDYVYSISVMEHIPISDLKSFFEDHYRILKTGGFGYHAIDFYLGNSELENVENRLDAYLQCISSAGLRFLDPPKIARPLTFRTEFATNPDLTMRYWNEIVPKLAGGRARLQSVSLAMALTKD
ncbi:MAG: class I SAM-dependent methyltransferase [Halioglobus sp.]